MALNKSKFHTNSNATVWAGFLAGLAVYAHKMPYEGEFTAQVTLMSGVPFAYLSGKGATAEEAVSAVIGNVIDFIKAVEVGDEIEGRTGNFGGVGFWFESFPQGGCEAVGTLGGIDFRALASTKAEGVRAVLGAFAEYLSRVRAAVEAEDEIPDEMFFRPSGVMTVGVDLPAISADNGRS